MAEKAIVKIDNKSIENIYNQIGKKLVKIYYVHDLDFSADTILQFDDCMLKIANDVINIEHDNKKYTEEYPTILINKVNRISNGYYSEDQYKTIKIDEPILNIKIARDKVRWYENDKLNYIDAQNIIRLELKDKDIIICGGSTIAESIEIYVDKEILETKLKIENLYRFDEKEDCVKEVEYERRWQTAKKYNI